MPKRTDCIVLFDVDGTLSEPRKVAARETLEFVASLRERVAVGVVGGSDLTKQQEQLGADCLSRFDYFFSENGLAAYKDGVELKKTSFLEHLGNEKLKKLTNFILHYIADLDIPVKRGTFVEFRNGMLNVSPIGRNCSQASRALASALCPASRPLDLSHRRPPPARRPRPSRAPRPLAGRARRV